MTYDILKIEINGTVHYATWHLRPPMVHVTSPLGSRYAQRNGRWPKDVAESLLRDLVTEARASFSAVSDQRAA